MIHGRAANSVCSGPVRSVFNAMGFDEDPSYASAKKKTKRLFTSLKFKISQFHWSFSNDIIAVKGLK